MQLKNVLPYGFTLNRWKHFYRLKRNMYVNMYVTQVGSNGPTERAQNDWRSGNGNRNNYRIDRNIRIFYVR